MQRKNKHIKGWLRFYVYSILLGVRYIIKRPLSLIKEVLKRIIIPMDIARYFEIPYTYKYLNLKKSDKVFDLSSPKLISLFASEIDKVKIVASDVWDKEVSVWKRLTNNMIGNSQLKNNITHKVIDGRKIDYKSGSFDKVFTISVIEHIPGSGDTKTIKELSRILKPGGTLILTTPFGKEYKENWVNKDAYSVKYQGKSVFLSRIYNNKALSERLIKPSGLILKRKLVCEERYPLITTIYTKMFPFSSILGLLFPFFAFINLRVGKHVGKKNNILLELYKSE